MNSRAKQEWGKPPWDDARWEALSDADTAGHMLEASERKFLEDYRPGDPALAAERSLRLALRDFGDEADRFPGRDEDALVTGTLEVFFDEDAQTNALRRTEEEGARTWVMDPPAERPQGRARYWRYGAAGGGLLAAAAAVALFMMPERGAVQTATPKLAAPTAIEATPASTAWSMRSGSMAGNTVFEADTKKSATFVTGPSGACLDGDDGSSACLGAGTKAKIDDGVLDLIEGTAEVEAAKVAYISLQAAGMRVESQEGKLVIQVDASESWRISVEEGQVSVYDLEGKVAQLRAGDVMARGQVQITVATVEPTEDQSPTTDPASPKAPRSKKTARSGKTATATDAAPAETGPSASEMLAEARKLRAAGRHAEAARAYEDLLVAHPSASASKTATVALGQLYLGPLNQPKSALTAFDRYIRSGGKTLAEEARYGKIRALKALGRNDEASRESTKFIAAYPNSSYAKALSK